MHETVITNILQYYSSYFTPYINSCSSEGHFKSTLQQYTIETVWIECGYLKTLKSYWKVCVHKISNI